MAFLLNVVLCFSPAGEPTVRMVMNKAGCRQRLEKGFDLNKGDNEFIRATSKAHWTKYMEACSGQCSHIETHFYAFQE
jgi:hypothetical protein